MKNLRLLFITAVLCIYADYANAQKNSIKQAMQQSDYPLAIELIDKEKPTFDLEMQKVSCLKMMNNFSGAIPLLKSISSRYTPNVYCLRELADCYLQTDNFNGANECLRKALSLSPENSVLLRLLGEDFEQEGKKDSAIVYYKKTIEKNPADFVTSVKLAKLYLKKNQLEEVLNLTNQCLQKDSLNVQMNKLSGAAYCLSNHYSKAIEQLKKIEAVDSTYDTNYFLGMSYYGNNNYANAKKYLKNVYSKDTANLNIIYYLGNAYAECFNSQAAIEYFKKGLFIAQKSDSTLYSFYSAISTTYHNQEKYKEEISALINSYKYMPTHSLILYKIASIYDLALKDDEKLKYYLEQYINKTLEGIKDKGEKTGKDIDQMYLLSAKKRLNELKDKKVSDQKKNK
ncbi:tetratricopeptide repeat protein [uncultured Bacteroides sp.]|uniref:tetratricopeptide repeat protein n=1 Tax=uncultured Bacteroides sp. TaxID=162156 RepID=UPI002AAC3BAE|nr:tetratricopeptide repeat protein [uncultured Bacteroides sp.]